ncbi:MAG: hypothetical protein CM15mV11_2500 [Caudoviricetes sp.]|nr:MAG: hypothetical protein CM15mV11_2500 [Caudoviricetes sp.]
MKDQQSKSSDKISMYKFINQVVLPRQQLPRMKLARTTLLATNRLGGSVSGLAKTVNNLENIYKASANNEKLVEIAERRRRKESKIDLEKKRDRKSKINGW